MKWQAADSTTTICFTLYCSNSTGAPGRITCMHAVQTNRYSKVGKTIDALVFRYQGGTVPLKQSNRTGKIPFLAPFI
jgi:hypothetical protein